MKLLEDIKDNRDMTAAEVLTYKIVHLRHHIPVDQSV